MCAGRQDVVNNDKEPGDVREREGKKKGGKWQRSGGG